MRGKKYWLLLLMVVNLSVILFGCIFNSGIEKNTMVFDQIPLLLWGEDTGQRNYMDESWQGGKFWFGVDTGEIPKGIYYVHVSYDTDSSANSIHFTPDIDSYRSVVADVPSLDSDAHELDLEIWVNRALNNLSITIDRDNVGSMQIDHITLERSQTRSFTYLILKLLMKLFAFDMVCFLVYWRERIRRNYVVWLGLSAIFVVGSLGVFTNCIIEGHDIWFHLARIEGIKDGLLSGAFPVKIQPNWLDGYGFAVSTMYGEALLYIPAILRVLGMPLQFCYKFYQIMINLLTVLVSYFVFYRITKDKYAGLLGTAVYSLANYRIGSIWIRSGVGEYSAMVFFPIIVLGVWEMLVADNTEEEAKKSWVWWVIGYTGLIQTHVLSCEIVTGIVALVCLFKIQRVFKKEIFLALCKSVAVVILVNLWFLVPFLDYIREDLKVFGEKNIEYIQRVGVTLYQLLSVVTGGRGTYQRYDSGISGNVPFSLGLVPIIVLLAAGILLFRREWNDKSERMSVMACFGLVLLSSFMSTDLFPWDFLTDLNSVLGGLIVSLRMPTRLMTVSVALTALLACLVYMKLREKLQSVHRKILVLGVCAAMAFECLLFSDFVMRGNSYFEKYDGQHMNWQLAISGAEYFYTGTTPLAALTDRDLTGDVVIGSVTRDHNSFLIECESFGAGILELPVFYYRGYQAVDLLTGESFLVGRGQNNKLQVRLPWDHKGKVAIYFREPWYWRAAEVVSLVVILLFGCNWVLNLKRSKNGSRENRISDRT